MVEVPACLVSQHALFLILSCYLHGEDGRHRSDPSGAFTGIGRAPNGHVRRTNVITELHSGFVAPHDELAPGFRPRAKYERDVHRHVLLVVSTRRHVEQPPSDVFQASVNGRPRVRSRGIRPLCAQLHREADTHEPDPRIVGE